MTKGRILLGLLFTAAGINHFWHPEFYEPMVPSYLGISPQLAVQVSGVFEILGGIGVLVERTRVFSAWGLIALLFAVFPANIHMAMHPADFGVSPIATYLRLPVQGLLVYWVWTVIPRRRSTNAEPSSLDRRTGQS